MSTEFLTADACQYIIEPQDFWQKRVSVKHKDQAPRVVAAPEGGEAWSFEGGNWLRPLGLQVAAGQAPIKDHGYSYSTIGKGTYDAKERLKAMATDGVEMASIFPTFGMEIRSYTDVDLHIECVRAYNDAILEWAKAGDAKRLIVHAILPATSMEAAQAEVTRITKLGGFHGVVSTGWPKGGMFPEVSEDPFYAQLAEAGLVLNLVRGGPVGPERMPAAARKHIGSNAAGKVRVSEPTLEALIVNSVVANPTALQFMAGGGVMDRTPRLRVSQLDNGSGWIACSWEGMDWQHRYSQFMKVYPNLKRRPSDYIQAQVKATVKNERNAIEARADIGTKMLMFASTYPTATSTWPQSQAVIRNLLVGVPDSEKRMILAENFLEWYGVKAPREAAGVR